MPFEFLNDDHLAQYSQFNSDPSPEQLAQYFQLNAEDRKLIVAQYEPHNRLGMGLQLVTLRFLGTFLADPTDVPRVIIRFMAEQIGITDTRNLKKYLKRKQTKFDHADRIRNYLNYKDFDALEILHLRRFLYAKLLVADERPIALFDLCTHELVERKVVLPGATTLARLIVQIRERVSQRLYRDLARRLTNKHKERLVDLVVPPEVGRKTPFEQLRTPPTRVSSSALVASLERVISIRDVGVSNISLQDIPESRLSSLSKYAAIAWAQHLAKLNLERRQATLLAFMQYLERSATDDVLDVFDALMNSLGLKSERKWRKERLRGLKDLDSSALLLRDAVRVLFDSSIPEAKVRRTVFERFPETRLLEADQHVTELASPEGEEEPQAWQNATNVIGKFILKLLSTLEFESTPSGKPLLTAMKWLQRTSGKSSDSWGEVPRVFVPKRWLGIVFPNDAVHRPAFVVCIAYQLQQALKRREVFVVRSHQHSDPRAQLLQGEAWEAKRADICRSLGLSKDPKVEIEKLTQQLDAAYKRVIKQLKTDPSIELESVDSILTPVIPPLESLPESSTFKQLDSNMTSRLPEIDLSELLLEVNATTGFCDSMILASEGISKLEDHALSVCAVLVAQACNIGLKAVAQLGHPALNLGRLAWVQQNYVRSDTILRANATLVEEHAKLPLVQRWGGGEVASADGLRFVVPVRSIHTRSNSKYFGAQRGDPARQVRLGIKRNHLLHTDQRSIHHVARDCCARNITRFPVHSSNTTRTTY